MLIVPTEKKFDWQHTPVVLFGIVILNLLVFFIYQSGDYKKINEALSTYLNADYLEKEWPVYQDYLKETDQAKQLEQSEKWHGQESFDVLAFQMLNDETYYRFLQRNQRKYFYESFIANWLTPRTQIHQTIQSLSSNRFGLKSTDIGLVQLFTHQFLHGDLLHLFGNLFFLVICGFAVEAAIGHRLFALFYLACGVIAGLTHSLFHLDDSSTLIGASGAISGVMAMYLAIFRLQKIEFFYWVFFFVGYFRAPALMILPLYVGKELVQYLNDPNARVAFLAHAGGFVAGAILILATLKLKPQSVNQDYIEEDQDFDPQRASMSTVYDHMERFQFASALKLLHEHAETYGNTFELMLLRYRLEKLIQSPQLNSTITELFVSAPKGHYLDQLAKLWRAHPNTAETLPIKKRVALANQFCSDAHVTLAENIFEQAQTAGYQQASMGVLARKLARLFAERKEPDKAKRYQNAAETFIQAQNRDSL